MLCCGLALPFAVMVTTSLRSSVSISILLACSLIPTVLLASLVGRFLPRWFSPVVYTLFAMVVVVACVPLILPISPEVADSLGIYVPILSINTILLTLCARYERPADRPVMALVDAAAYSLGFALAMCLLAFFRELLGAGSLWGVPVPLPFKAEGVQIEMCIRDRSHRRFRGGANRLRRMKFYIAVPLFPVRGGASKQAL